MKELGKTALLGSAAALTAVGALTAVSYGVSSALLHMALDRQAPRMMVKGRDRLTGDSGWRQLAEHLEAGSRYLRTCNCTRVEIRADDGTRLVGHWYENPQPRRVVVAMHGWRSRWDQDFGLIAPFLQENGCSVLYAEQRGQQQSGGDTITFGLLERYDCLAWVRWVQQHTVPGLPVYLAGISMGATTVLLAAGEQLPSCVRGVIADCGYTSPYEIWRHVAEENLHLHYGLHHFWVRQLCRRRLHTDLQTVCTKEALKRCRVPVLLIHGTEDRFVPVSMTYENYLACNGPRQLLIVPGAGHGMSYLTEPEKYKQAVLQFWQTYG